MSKIIFNIVFYSSMFYHIDKINKKEIIKTLLLNRIYSIKKKFYYGGR